MPEKNVDKHEWYLSKKKKIKVNFVFAYIR